jgi:hypothetical protein
MSISIFFIDKQLHVGQNPGASGSATMVTIIESVTCFIVTIIASRLYYRYSYLNAFVLDQIFLTSWCCTRYVYSTIVLVPVR